jgi:hypothetical protein
MQSTSAVEQILDKEPYLCHSRQASARESDTGIPHIDEILGTFGILVKNVRQVKHRNERIHLLSISRLSQQFGDL